MARCVFRLNFVGTKLGGGVKEEVFKIIQGALWDAITNIHCSKTYLDAHREILDIYQEARLRTALHAIKATIEKMETGLGGRQMPAYQVLNDSPEL